MADENITNEEGLEPSVEDLKAQIEQLQADNAKLKQATTNASSDAAKYKKELRERQTEQERKAEEEAEEKAKLLARLEELETASRNEKGKAGFLSVGFSEATAKDVTDAFYKGDLDAFIPLLKSFVTEHDKAITAESVRRTPPPASGGNGAKQYTKEQFMAMSYKEMNDLYNSDPELYNTLRNS